MEERDIAIKQRIHQMVAGCGLPEGENRRLAELMEDAAKKWTEERRERSGAIATESRSGVKYISCPYTDEERERIMDWIYAHKTDTKGLAVALWLSGGIAPQRIINLRREDCRGDKNTGEGTEFDKKIFRRWSRAEIIRKAIKLHPDDLEFVFMFPKGAEWKKLDGSSIPMKLYNICDEVGITYKSFRKNEAIALNED